MDFDERIVKSIIRFAEKHDFADRVGASLYNVVDALPKEYFGRFDAFYTNPPWGASNSGESVCAFLERGIEATNARAQGVIVIADDPQMAWTQQVLLECQRRAARMGFVVGELVPQMHLYHLDDAPNLRSCTCLLRRVEAQLRPAESIPLARARTENFYGRNNPLRVRYVREHVALNYGKAPDNSYTLEHLE